MGPATSVRGTRTNVCGIEVPVPVEADVGRLPRRDDPHQVRLEGVFGQGQETRAFFREGLGHRAGGVTRHAPGVRDRVPPLDELGVQIVQIAERAGPEEAVPEVANGPLHAAFLVAARRGAGPRDEVRVAAELQEARVKADRVPLPLQDRAAEVIVEHGPRHPAKRRERLHVAAEEALQRLVQGEDRVQRPRPAQDQDERGEGPRGAADPDRPEGPPVSRGLFARQDGEAEVRFRGPRRAQGAYHAAELDGRALIAPLPEHHEQPGGPEPRIPLEGLLEEGAVGVELARPHARGPREAVGGQGPAHGVGMQAELRRDGADPPVLGEEESADLGNLRRGDHGRPSRRRSGGAPRWPPPGQVLGPPGERPPAAADGTAGATSFGRDRQPGPDMGTSWSAMGANRGDRQRRTRRQHAGEWGCEGSLMRHARLAAGPVGPLPVAVVQPAFGALLVPAARGAETPGAPLPAARETTVGVPAITRAAEEERPPAEPAGPHEEALHGPAGPEMAGGRWTTGRECGTPGMAGPRPRGVGLARGPGAHISRPSSSHLRGGQQSSAGSPLTPHQVHRLPVQSSALLGER